MNCSSGQNILNEVKNWKKIGEDYGTLICSFLYFLISVVKVLLWRLCTGLCLYPDLRFFIVKKFVSWKNLGQNHTSSLPTISPRQVIAPGRTASKSPPLSPKQQSMYAIPNTSMQQVPESRILKSRPLILLSLSYQSQGQGQVSVYKMVIGVNYHPSPSGWTSRV